MITSSSEAFGIPYVPTDSTYSASAQGSRWKKPFSARTKRLSRAVFSIVAAGSTPW